MLLKELLFKIESEGEVIYLTEAGIRSKFKKTNLFDDACWVGGVANGEATRYHWDAGSLDEVLSTIEAGETWACENFEISLTENTNGTLALSDFKCVDLGGCVRAFAATASGLTFLWYPDTLHREDGGFEFPSRSISTNPQAGMKPGGSAAIFNDVDELVDAIAHGWEKPLLWEGASTLKDALDIFQKHLHCTYAAEYFCEACGEGLEEDEVVAGKVYGHAACQPDAPQPPLENVLEVVAAGDEQLLFYHLAYERGGLLPSGILKIPVNESALESMTDSEMVGLLVGNDPNAEHEEGDERTVLKDGIRDMFRAEDWDCDQWVSELLPPSWETR